MRQRINSKKTADQPAASTSPQAAYSAGHTGYISKQAKDGTWSIFNVPVFADHIVPETGERFGPDRLKRAVAINRQRAKEGYLGPLHIKHHKQRQDEPVERAGHFQFKGVQTITYQGEPVKAIIADFVRIPDEQYQKIKAGRFPYVSVEILDLESGEIDSIAMLDHEVPFFRMPLVNISEEVPREDIAMAASLSTYRFADRSTPALAYSAGGGKAGVLFAFDTPLAVYQETPGETPIEETEMPAEEMLAQLLALMSKIAEKLGVGEEEAEEETPPMEAPEASMMDDDEHKKPAHRMEDDEEHKKKEMQASLFQAKTQEDLKQEARIFALEEQLKQREENERVEKLCNATIKELGAYGITEEHRARFEKIARTAGAEGLRVYAQTVKETCTPRPPEMWTGELDASYEDPKEVMAYSHRGPNVLADARRLHSMWKNTKSLQRHSLETFLASTELGDANGKGN